MVKFLHLQNKDVEKKNLSIGVDSFFEEEDTSFFTYQNIDNILKGNNI